MFLHLTNLRQCILYEFKNGFSATEIVRSTHCTSVNVALNVQICESGFGQSQSENSSFADFPRSEQPSSNNIDLLQNVVEENPMQTVRELSKRFNRCHTLIIRDLHELENVLA